MVVCADPTRRRRRRSLAAMQPQHAYCYGPAEGHAPAACPPHYLHHQSPGGAPHRDPPPYPAQFKPLYLPGYRQSYSGSETSTDLSLSSTENLSTSTRQDPQGEETTAGVTTPSLDPWDNLLGEVNYGALSQLANIAATSGVEVKATNSGTFYVTGNRPTTSGSPNQELLYWSSEGTTHPGTSYGTNMVTGMQGYPLGTSATMCAASGKLPVGVRPRSAHGAPGTRKPEVVHMVPRPASVNTSPYPGIYAAFSEGCPPRAVCMPNIVRQEPLLQSKPMQSNSVNAASISTAGSMVVATMSGGGNMTAPTHVSNMSMSFPPPPQYPGHSGSVQAALSSNTHICQNINSDASSAMKTHMTMVANNVSVCTKPQQPRPFITKKKLSSSTASSTTASLTGSNDSSPAVSGGESPPAGTANTSPPTSTAAGPTTRPNPPDYKTSLNTDKNSFCHPYEVIEGTQQSNSQPDLLCLNDSTSPARLSPSSAKNTANKSTGPRTPSPQPLNLKPQNGVKKSNVDHATIALRTTKLVERLSEENRQLRQELDGYCRKVTKLQKFEIEIQKVHDSYEALVKQSHRRESLEKIMRFRLEAETRKLSETNKELKDQLNKALSQLEQKQVYDISDSELKKEIQKKDSMISKLISQNKELSAAKERLEIEIAAQRSTLQEQRVHIDVLNTAIVNAQSQSMRLEEEVVRKAAQDDVVTELQRTVGSLQIASDKKDSLHQRLLAKLEEEITNLQGRQLQSSLGGSRTSDLDEGISSSDSEPSIGIQTLIQQLRKREQRILQLEVDIVKLEERYLEEHALRQLAVDAASLPKDARIAALEQNSTETGKIIAEAKTDRLKHLEETYQANRKVAELEAKVKTCQAQLAEKDAMIAVIQKHNSLSRASSVSSLLYSPLHSPRPSLTSSLASSLASSSLASSLTSSLASSAMSSSSSSAPVSSPNSCASSRQSSQIDTCLYREARQGLHNKSNSTGSAGITNNTGSPNDKNQEAQIKELKQRLAAQAKLFQTLQLGPDQLSKCLWQV